MSVFLSEESFKTYMQKELRSIDSSLSFELQEYLVDLLHFYLKSERLNLNQATHGFESSLAALSEKIQQAPRSERIYFLKRMGDFTLYISGFLRDSFFKKVVSVSYYEALGQNAYSSLSGIYGSKNNIFESLAEQFHELSQDLFHVQKRAKENLQSQTDRFLVKSQFKDV